MKRCITCKEEKPESEFGARTDRPGKTRSYCKACGLAYTRKYQNRKKEEMISSSRFKQVHTGLSAIAQKVYAATPISEPWSHSRIHAEMQRNGGSTKDLHVVMGCINSLIASGLVVESERGAFVRSPVKEKPAEKPAQQLEIPPTLETPKEPMTTAKPIQSPVAILAVIATRAKATSESIRKLADDIETAALEIEEGIAAGEAEIAKLRQLQQLLKSLG